MASPLPNPRPAAITLIVLAVLSLFVMLHHPTIGAHAPGDVLAEIQRERPINAAVHGVMIAVVLLYHWCFSVLGAWLGATRGAVSLAQLALNLGLSAFVGAALVSGFVVPELASRVEPSVEGLGAVLSTLYATNQVLANLGTLSFGGAIAIWGVLLWLLPTPTVRSRAAGAVGVLAALSIVLGLLAGVWSLDVAGMTVLVVLLGVWGCAAAAWLWQRANEATAIAGP